MVLMRPFSSLPSRTGSATDPGELKSYSTDSAFQEGFVDLKLCASALIHQAAFVDPLAFAAAMLSIHRPRPLLPLDHPSQLASIEAADVAALRAEGLGATEIAKRLGIGRARSTGCLPAKKVRSQWM
jgi:hypothetical protein